jgi:hypothetical protein
MLRNVAQYCGLFKWYEIYKQNINYLKHYSIYLLNIHKHDRRSL